MHAYFLVLVFLLFMLTCSIVLLDEKGPVEDERRKARKAFLHAHEAYLLELITFQTCQNPDPPILHPSILQLHTSSFLLSICFPYIDTRTKTPLNILPSHQRQWERNSSTRKTTTTVTPPIEGSSSLACNPFP